MLRHSKLFPPKGAKAVNFSTFPVNGLSMN